MTFFYMQNDAKAMTPWVKSLSCDKSKFLRPVELKFFRGRFSKIKSIQWLHNFLLFLMKRQTLLVWEGWHPLPEGCIIFQFEPPFFCNGSDVGYILAIFTATWQFKDL